MSRPTRSAQALDDPLLISVSGCASRTVPSNGRVSTPTATAGGATPGQHTDWLQFGFDAARSGVNPKETRICAGNVGQPAAPSLAGIAAAWHRELVACLRAGPGAARQHRA